MSVVERYMDDASVILSKMCPDKSDEEISKVINKLVKLRKQDPSIVMDNNVTGENHTITLTKMCNWLDAKLPVVSGNATFYVQPEVLEAPASTMLREMKQDRKNAKKRMFSFSETSDEYAREELVQLNIKVVMNADYGASGAKTSAFYTKYSPAATTLMAQSIITIMASFFESFVGAEVKFYSTNECYDWLLSAMRKDMKVPKWMLIPNRKDVYDRLVSCFIEFDNRDAAALESFVNNIGEDDLCKIYYGNNIYEFIRNHAKCKTILKNILTSLPTYEASETDVPDEFKSKFAEYGSNALREYNIWVSKEMFMNPYDLPECIKSDIDKLGDLFMKYVYIEHIVPDSIIKLNNHKRKVILLVDTDSNVINADIFVKFVMDEIFEGETFGRNRMYNDIICINTLASTLQIAVSAMLDYYGRTHNMNEKARAEISMKNEFMFKRLFLMKVKKRYSALILLREGNIMMPMKSEIKGVDFIKSGVTDQVKNTFIDMIETHILYADIPDVYGLLEDVRNFQKEIINDLKAGGTTYLKPQTYKPADAYKNSIDDNGATVLGAWKIQSFRGVTVWNEIYPDNKIYTMDRVKIVKLKTTSVDEIEWMKEKYPVEYHNIVNNVYGSKTPSLSKSGISIICLPSTMAVIPDWMIEMIDYDIMISNTVASFNSVLDSFGIDYIVVKTPHGKSATPSGLISI